MIADIYIHAKNEIHLHCLLAEAFIECDFKTRNCITKIFEFHFILILKFRNWVCI